MNENKRLMLAWRRRHEMLSGRLSRPLILSLLARLVAVQPRSGYECVFCV